MADTKLQIILNLKDNASAQLKTFNGKIKASADQIKSIGVKMAAIGGISTIAFGKAIDESAKAEGALNKFNTVFGDGKDEMMAFVEALRKEMPTATQDIISMAAGMQDLLVPMTGNRDMSQELTEGFLDLANKVAAFNDVDPTISSYLFHIPYPLIF